MSRAEGWADLEGMSDLTAATYALYKDGGPQPGASTGWPVVDQLYTVGMGQWTVITGTPGSGKSEWLDAMLVNLAEAEDWSFAVYSPENFPTSLHVVKLTEKRARLPFNQGPVTRMTEQQMRAATDWVIQRFLWLSPELKTPDEIIKDALSFRGLSKNFGVILDPWNTLDHQRMGLSETDYISFILTEVTKLARKMHAHVWVVVHPAKIPRNKDGSRPVPTPYDISGSAHWYNKADNVVTIHRDQASGSQEVEIHVQKVRFKHIGHVGLAQLMYDKVSGRYFDLGHPPFASDLYADPERGNPPPPPIPRKHQEREPGQEG